MISLKTMSRAVSCESAPFMRGAMPDRCEGAFDRIRRPQMRPMFGGEIKERQQRVAILEQTVDGLVVFWSIFLREDYHPGFGGRAVLEQPDFAQILMRVGLNGLR